MPGMQDQGNKPEQVRGYYPKASGGNGMSKNALIVAIAIAVIISVLAMQMFFLPSTLNKYVLKTDDSANYKALSDSVASTQTDVTQKVTAMQGKIDSFSDVITEKVTTAINQNTMSITNQVNSMQTQVNNMAGLVKTATDKADSYQTTITDLQTRLATAEATITTQTDDIKKLQGDGSGDGSTSESPIKITGIQIVNRVFEYYTTTDNVTVTLVTFGVKLHLDNMVAADLEDIELEVPIEVDAENDIISLTDTSSNWYPTDKNIDDTYAEATMVGDSISLDASQKNKKITIGIKVLVYGIVDDISINADEDDVVVVDWGYE